MELENKSSAEWKGSNSVMDVGVCLLRGLGYTYIFKVVMTILRMIEWTLQNAKQEDKNLEKFLETDFEKSNDFDILKEELK